MDCSPSGLEVLFVLDEREWEVMPVAARSPAYMAATGYLDSDMPPLGYISEEGAKHLPLLKAAASECFHNLPRQAFRHDKLKPDARGF